MVACLIVGFCLNVVGIALSVSALLQPREADGPFSLWPGLSEFWRRVRRKPRPAIGHMSGSGSGTLTVSGRARGRAPDDDAPLETQIAHLRAEVDQAFLEMYMLDSQQTRALSEVRHSVDAARTESERGLRDMRERNKDTTARTVPRQFKGLILIGLGSLVSVLPALLGWA